nr:immunoglobulin heavy chain junction region [Macaca mulatta]MOV53796.1 immunoglobulin heavy chain junction region [Macaca mulatta]MOV54248.1 immunoglobulin heavy chain junction region [Macaca mulatta]MOV55931.1 immunoglobulin heavy chain junction region [Macaca mulatta]MOV58985.1 immunoglobulin heavy chain junction region [Macaca mulatta]
CARGVTVWGGSLDVW